MGIPKKEEREEKEESVWRNNDQKFPNVIKEIYASQKLIRLQEGSIQRGLRYIAMKLSKAEENAESSKRGVICRE